MNFNGAKEVNKHPSSSDEQQISQQHIIKAVSKEIGLGIEQLEKTKIKFIDGSYLEIGGFHKDPNVLCEASAHIGKMGGSQPHKVMNDAMKMLFVEKFSNTKFRKILAFADLGAARSFKENSWRSKCLKEYGIEVLVIEIPEEIRNIVIDAQYRQKMVNIEL